MALQVIIVEVITPICEVNERCQISSMRSALMTSHSSRSTTKVATIYILYDGTVSRRGCNDELLLLLIFVVVVLLILPLFVTPPSKFVYNRPLSALPTSYKPLFHRRAALSEPSPIVSDDGALRGLNRKFLHTSYAPHRFKSVFDTTRVY